MGKRSSGKRDKYSRAKYLLSLDIRHVPGTFCPSCGERCYRVVSPTGTTFLVTTQHGKASCLAIGAR